MVCKSLLDSVHERTAVDLHIMLYLSLPNTANPRNLMFEAMSTFPQSCRVIFLPNILIHQLVAAGYMPIAADKEDRAYKGKKNAYKDGG